MGIIILILFKNFLFENICFIKLYLVYSVVLISDSFIHISTFLFMLFSIRVHHRVLNIVPCAVQYDLVIYPSYIYFAITNPKLSLFSKWGNTNQFGNIYLYKPGLGFSQIIWFKILTQGMSLAVQWLRLCLTMQRLWVQSTVREPRSHISCGQKTKSQNRNNIVTNLIRT